METSREKWGKVGSQKWKIGKSGAKSVEKWGKVTKSWKK